MKNEVWTRLSEMRDAPTLMEIDRLVWDDRNTPSERLVWDSREQFLQSCPPGSQIVAGIGEQVCGYIGFKPPTPLPSNAHVLELNIAIHPECQRMGIGRALMEALLAFAAQRAYANCACACWPAIPGPWLFTKAADLWSRDGSSASFL